MVFFDRNSASLTREAKRILDTARDVKAGDCGGTWVFGLSGHADGSERPDMDRRRVDTVRRYLQARGYRDGRFVIRYLGTTQPRIVRPPGVAEVQNRRVEIVPAHPE